jgi:hypothetical protein
VADGTCSIEGCEKAAKLRGWCSPHYQRWWRHGNPLGGRPSNIKGLACSVNGCSDPQHSRGWCQRHYQSWRYHGDPLASTVRIPWPNKLTDQMAPQPNGCIWFTGTINSDGYGLLRYEDENKAHRSAYRFFVGPIPEDHDIDHECHNRDLSCKGGPTCLHRRCVNPSHLAPKTRRDNIDSSHRMNGTRTHCKWGHEYTDPNTYRLPNGKRVCRICARASSQRYRDRRSSTHQESHV